MTTTAAQSAPRWLRLDLDHIPTDLHASPWVHGYIAAPDLIEWARTQLWAAFADARSGDGVQVGVGPVVMPIAESLADIVAEARARGVTVRLVVLSEVAA